MPLEVLSATGKSALNASALVNAEGSFHHATRQSHLPGRATAEPNLRQGLGIMNSKIVQRELLGPAGTGPSLHHIGNPLAPGVARAGRLAHSGCWERRARSGIVL
jgi:hypothetical protein